MENIIKKRGRRYGTTPTEVRENKRLIEAGLPPMKPPHVRKKKSDATLPVSKKQRSQEILAEMLGRKSRNVVQKILEKALDDGDKDQLECLKIVMDRILPKDYLSKNNGKGNSINIQIMGVDGHVAVSEESNIIEAEYEDLDDDSTS